MSENDTSKEIETDTLTYFSFHPVPLLGKYLLFTMVSIKLFHSFILYFSFPFNFLFTFLSLPHFFPFISVFSTFLSFHFSLFHISFSSFLSFQSFLFPTQALCWILYLNQSFTPSLLSFFLPLSGHHIANHLLEYTISIVSTSFFHHFPSFLLLLFFFPLPLDPPLINSQTALTSILSCYFPHHSIFLLSSSHYFLFHSLSSFLYFYSCFLSLLLFFLSLSTFILSLSLPLTLSFTSLSNTFSDSLKIRFPNCRFS